MKFAAQDLQSEVSERAKLYRLITKFRNNPKGQIPLIPPNRFLPTAGKREADIDAATGGEFKKMLGR